MTRNWIILTLVVVTAPQLFAAEEEKTNFSSADLIKACDGVHTEFTRDFCAGFIAATVFSMKNGCIFQKAGFDLPYSTKAAGNISVSEALEALRLRLESNPDEKQLAALPVLQMAVSKTYECRSRI